MTPARNMSVCVPLPVPRAQASFVMWRSRFERSMLIVETNGCFVGCVGWHESSRVLRHFGPRRHR